MAAAYCERVEDERDGRRAASSGWRSLVCSSSGGVRGRREVRSRQNEAAAETREALLGVVNAQDSGPVAVIRGGGCGMRTAN
jgi:hypothetical protein